MKKMNCLHGHRMIEVVSKLWLCECSSSGWLSNLKGVDVEARTLVERHGGIGALRDKIERQEIDEREARNLARQGRRASASLHGTPGA